MNASQDFSVRFSADTRRFESGNRRARANFDRNATAIERRAGRLDSRLASVGGRFSGRRGQVLGNVSQQFQDIAVQAESGTNAVRIFAQQGPQIAGAFGPAGAAVGALIAVIGLGLSAFNAFGTGTEEAAKELKDFDARAGDVMSAIGGLEEAAYAYSEAISATSNAQVSASNTIVAQTEREFEAKKDLLELEVERLKIQQAERSAIIARKELEANPKIPSRREFIDNRVSQAFTAGQPLPDQVRKVLEQQAGNEFDEKFILGDFREKLDKAAEAARIVKKELALEVLDDIAIEKGEAALGKSFTDLAAGSKQGQRDAKKGSKTKRDVDIFANARERIANLEAETTTIGVYGLALDRLQARQQAARLESELLNKAREDGKPATEAQKQQISALADEYLKAADRVAILKAAEEERIKTVKDQKKATEDLAKSFSDVTDQIINQAVQARNLGDAFRSAGAALLKSGILGAVTGSGPFGPIFNSFLGVSSGGLSGLFGGAGSANVGGGFSSGVPLTAFAKGGIVSSPTMFGFGGGKNLGLMGEAGPEAIMPLSRGKGGKLGVVADQHVHVTVDAGPEFDVKVQQTAGAQTSAMIGQNNKVRDRGFETRFKAADGEIRRNNR